MALAVNPPDWNTHAGFMTDRTRTVGYIKRTQVTLAQTAYAVVHPDNVETLDVEVEVGGAVNPSARDASGDEPTYLQCFSSMGSDCRC